MANIPDFLSEAEVRANAMWTRRIAQQIDAGRPREPRFPYAAAFLAQRRGPSDAVQYVQMWSNCSHRAAVDFVKKHMAAHLTYDE